MTPKTATAIITLLHTIVYNDKSSDLAMSRESPQKNTFNYNKLNNNMQSYTCYRKSSHRQPSIWSLFSVWSCALFSFCSLLLS